MTHSINTATVEFFLLYALLSTYPLATMDRLNGFSAASESLGPGALIEDWKTRKREAEERRLEQEQKQGRRLGGCGRAVLRRFRLPCIRDVRRLLRPMRKHCGAKDRKPATLQLLHPDRIYMRSLLREGCPPSR